MDANEIIWNMSVAKDVDQLWNEFVSLLSHEYGIESLFYGTGHSKLSSKLRGLTNSAWIKQNHPDEYFDVHETLINHDPDNFHCIDNIHENFWHESIFRAETTLQKNAVEHAAGCGLNVGITLPIHAKDNPRGWSGIGLNFDEKSVTQMQATWKHRKDELVSICYKFDQLLRTNHIEELHPLNEKQIVILSLLAAEYGTKRTAAHMGLTEKTINYHVEQASKQLNTHTREGTIALFAILSDKGAYKSQLINYF